MGGRAAAPTALQLHAKLSSSLVWLSSRQTTNSWSGFRSHSRYGGCSGAIGDPVAQATRPTAASPCFCKRSRSSRATSCSAQSESSLRVDSRRRSSRCKQWTASCRRCMPVWTLVKGSGSRLLPARWDSYGLPGKHLAGKMTVQNDPCAKFVGMR